MRLTREQACFVGKRRWRKYDKRGNVVSLTDGEVAKRVDEMMKPDSFQSQLTYELNKSLYEEIEHRHKLND
jgi:hypothetical protein